MLLRVICMEVSVSGTGEGCVGGRGDPAGQQVERLLGAASRVRRCRSRCVRPVSAESSSDLVGELELADDRVVKALGAGLVVADVVRRPPGAELVAAGGQLADEVRELRVVRVAAGLGAQVRDEVRGGALPVGVEVLRGGVEEGEAGAVGRLLAALEHRRVQGAAERVGGEVVEAAVAHDRRARHLRRGSAARPGGLAAAPSARRLGADGVGGAREVVAGGRARRRRAAAPGRALRARASETPLALPRSRRL